MNEPTVTAFERVDPPQPVEGSFSRLTVGELLRRELAVRGISQAELAARTGLSTKHVNQVIKNVAPMSAETALLLERATGVSADLLTRLEAKREAERTREDARRRLNEYADWFNEFPLPVLAARSIIDRRDPIAAQIDQLLGWFGLADPTAFERIYADSLVSFRRAQHLNVNAKATAVWLRLGEVHAEHIQETTSVPAFDRKAFTALLNQIPSLTRQPFAVAATSLKDQCLNAGVHVILFPELKGTRAAAATRWIGDRPVIILSGRGRKEDSLWFSFFHEAGHVVLHPKRRSPVFLDGDGDDADGRETEANEFATDHLLRHQPPTVLDEITTPERAEELAQLLNVDRGIIGGLAAHAHDAWARFSKVRKTLPEFDAQPS